MLRKPLSHESAPVVTSLVDVCATAPVHCHSIISPDVIVMLDGLKTKSSTLTIWVVELPVETFRFESTHGIVQFVVVIVVDGLIIFVVVVVFGVVVVVTGVAGAVHVVVVAVVVLNAVSHGDVCVDPGQVLLPAFDAPSNDADLRKKGSSLFVNKATFLFCED